MSKMHEEDEHDDNLIAMETSNQIQTRAQKRAAENAAHSHILEPPDVDTDIISPLGRTAYTYHQKILAHTHMLQRTSFLDVLNTCPGLTLCTCYLM